MPDEIQAAEQREQRAGRIDSVDAVFSLLRKNTRATKRLVISKYCNGGNVGTIGHVAGKHGHGCLEHRYIRGTLSFGFGCCLGDIAAASCKRRGRGTEMIERLHVEHHFV